MRVRNPDCSSVESIAETQPQLQTDALRLSAMISQYLARCFVRLSLFAGQSQKWEHRRQKSVDPKNQKPPVSFPLFRCQACLRQRAMIRHKPPYAIRYSTRLPHFWQVLKSITSVALEHCVRHSPETGGPSDRNCSRASLHSDVVSVYYLQCSAISA